MTMNETPAASGVSGNTPDPRVDALRSVMIDPAACSCKGTGWQFNDKSYDGYANGLPYEEPTRDNGGYSPCGFCNLGGWNHDGPMLPERRWSDAEIAEIVDALAAVDVGNTQPEYAQIGWRYRWISSQGNPGSWEFTVHHLPENPLNGVLTLESVPVFVRVAPTADSSDLT